MAIPFISREDRDFILDLVRSFDRSKKPEPAFDWDRPPQAPTVPPDEGGRPGDDFNLRGTWEEILPAGWVKVRRMANLDYWRRPGKDVGISATTGVRPDCGRDLLWVFTTSAAPLQAEKSYSKFSAFTALYHGGDYRAAALALAGKGYGSPNPFEGVKLTRSKAAENGKHEPAAQPIVRIPASQLRRLTDAEKWLWKGLIPAEAATIISAYPKAGKTTILSHLLHGMEAGGDFCGQEVRLGKVVYVTEESETIWAERRDKIGLADHCEFVLRPFRQKPKMPAWLDFLKRLTDSLAGKPADLVVFDTLAKLWPVENENDASEVTAALMPLLEIAYGVRATLLLVHHLRKSDGLETNGTRGSGGITASVDSIIELRRYKPGDRKDRRRVLACDARFDGRLDELVVELSEDGTAYSAHGERDDVRRVEIINVLLNLLPNESPGWTVDRVKKEWPAEGNSPWRQALVAALQDGAEDGSWSEEGTGKKGSPLTYWKPVACNIFDQNE